jgi:hypothetical protein
MTETTSGPDPIDRRISYLVARTRALSDGVAGKATLESLDRLIKRTGAAAVRVIIVGEVSRGKSTLINALIGRPLLPDAAEALTSTWTVLRYGSQLFTEATLVTPKGVERVPVAEKNLDAYMTASGEKTVRKYHGPGVRVASVEVELPAPILAGGLQFIDTPGVGGLAAAHRYATLAALREADALLFVIKPGAPISATERRFLAEAVKPLEACVIVQTHRDLVPEPDAWLDEDMKTLRDPRKWEDLLTDRAEAGEPGDGGEQMIAEAQLLAERFKRTKSVSVSALTVLRAAGDLTDPVNARLYANSGLPLLVDVLTDVTADGHNLHRKNVLRLIESIASECQRRLTDRVVMLTQSEASERLINERKQRLLKWSDHGGAHWRPVLDSAYTELARDLKEHAASRATEIGRDFRRRIGDMSAIQIVTETRALLAVPDAVLAELNQLSAKAMTEAVGEVRALLTEDELDGPLTRLAETDAVFSRLPGGFEKIPAGRDPNDIRAMLAGGGAVAGAAALGVTVLANAGAAAIAAPIVIPFILGAGAYLWINRRAREERRNREGALELLTLVCDEIKSTAVAAVLKSAEEAKKTMAAVIVEGIGDLEAQVEQDRKDLSETAGLTAEQRTAQLTDARQGLRDADEIARSVSMLREEL